MEKKMMITGEVIKKPEHKVIFGAFTIDFSRSTAIFDVRSLSYGYYDAQSERI